MFKMLLLVQVYFWGGGMVSIVMPLTVENPAECQTIGKQTMDKIVSRYSKKLVRSSEYNCTDVVKISEL